MKSKKVFIPIKREFIFEHILNSLGIEGNTKTIHENKISFIVDCEDEKIEELKNEYWSVTGCSLIIY